MKSNMKRYEIFLVVVLLYCRANIPLKACFFLTFAGLDVGFACALFYPFDLELDILNSTFCILNSLCDEN